MLGWLASLRWRVALGPDIVSGMPAAARADYGEVVLSERLRSVLGLTLETRDVPPGTVPLPMLDLEPPVALEVGALLLPPSWVH